MINNGKTNEMPAQEGKLTDAQINVLTAYVWGLSNKPGAASRSKGGTQVPPFLLPNWVPSEFMTTPSGKHRKVIPIACGLNKEECLLLFMRRRKRSIALHQWRVCTLAVDSGVPDAAGVLWPAMASVGTAAVGVIRSGCEALLSFWPGFFTRRISST